MGDNDITVMNVMVMGSVSMIREYVNVENVEVPHFVHMENTRHIVKYAVVEDYVNITKEEIDVKFVKGSYLLT